jgi:hypothetical protein
MLTRTLAVFVAASFGLIGWGWPLPTELSQPFVEPGDQIISEVRGATPCRVSYDGFIWYAIGPGQVPPIAARLVECPDGSHVSTARDTVVPQWAKPSGSTQALFAAVSFHEVVSRAGMQELGRIAHAYGIPITWMTGQPATFDAAGDLYDDFHRRFGDDLQTRPTNHNPFARSSPTRTHFAELARKRFGWFRPTVAIEGAGYARDIAADMAEGYRAFWGIAWNSHGLDNDYDEGAPWGAYCADPSSYKRPDPNGRCALVGLEWTARDLTRAAISDHEAYYSTDPDDLQAAGFDARSGAQYVRALVDAYAAAGETQPLVMVVQQEADQMGRPPRGSSVAVSAALLDAIYSQAKADGMRPVTLSQAAALAKLFAGQPRAIAFPYIASTNVPEARTPWSYRGPYPGTIDYHDDQAGMSFIEGRATPVRVFPYARAVTTSAFVTLPRLQRSEMPTLTGAQLRDGVLTLSFDAPVAVRYGVALWSDPAKVRWSASHALITYAGRAGAVAAFDLPRGASDVVLHCTGCSSTTFPIAP